VVHFSRNFRQACRNFLMGADEPGEQPERNNGNTNNENQIGNDMSLTFRMCERGDFELFPEQIRRFLWALGDFHLVVRTTVAGCPSSVFFGGDPYSIRGDAVKL
jgi:hypothetical protein